MNEIIKEYKIEICANSAQSALNASIGGANRVELCSGIPEGGITPSIGEIRATRRLLDSLNTQTQLNVIIRPRGGDFLYSDLEISIMLDDICAARDAGADGVVFGCLTSNGDVDLSQMEKLMLAAEGMDMTFHRAFDMCRNPFDAMEDIIELGCRRILTSGQKISAEDGIPLINYLISKASQRIVIMPGCGIRENNIRKIAKETGASEFHFSARSSVESEMKWRNANVSMGGVVMIDEYQCDVTDPKKVAAAIEQLQK